MRHQHQKENAIKSYNNLSLLDDHNIAYSEQNNVITIFHPHTGEKIRRSLVSNKTYYKKEWTTAITLLDIVKWYTSKSSQLSSEFVFLDCPFGEKDIVKKLGARWNTDKKKWYVTDTSFNRETFKKWIK